VGLCVCCVYEYMSDKTVVRTYVRRRVIWSFRVSPSYVWSCVLMLLLLLRRQQQQKASRKDTQ
jgi:hypothetical protein